MNLISNISIFCLLLISQCYSQSYDSKYYSFPDSYPMEEMKKINLTDDMEEISGLEWIDEKTLWAIEDESSLIFELNAESGKITRKKKFAKNKDIEDILFYEDKAWVLQSNGNIYEVSNPLTEYSNTEMHEFPIKKKRDFEAIIKPKNEPEIWIFCKVCSWDENSNRSSIFSFNLESKEFKEDAKRVLENEQLAEIMEGEDFKKVKMQPSAIALHPFENQYYLLSSSDHWLMVLDPEMTPKAFYHLNPKLFKQPEGITFSPDGNMFISNEAVDGKPNFLYFPYRP